MSTEESDQDHSEEGEGSGIDEDGTASASSATTSMSISSSASREEAVQNHSEEEQGEGSGIDEDGTGTASAPTSMSISSSASREEAQEAAQNDSEEGEGSGIDEDVVPTLPTSTTSTPISSSARNKKAARQQAILEKFQDFTGMQDTEEARTILEDCNWVLNEAIETVLNQVTQLSARIQAAQTTQTPPVNHHEENVDMDSEARARLLQEQNDAYNESLRADIAKREARLQAEAEAKEKEDKAARDATERAQMKLQLPPEPPEPDNDNPDLHVYIIKIRIIDRNEPRTLVRRFFPSDPIQALYDFLFSEGYSKEEWGFFSYPKCDLVEAYADGEQTIGSIFKIRDTITVEKR